jgi:nitrite reductase/ring-hydroxylating ferredoxin subunit
VETVEFTEVAAATDLTEGQMRAVHVDGKRVLLALVDGVPYAMGAVCTHERAKLDEGTLMGHEIYCPLHFSCFDVRTGEALAPPADQAANVYAVKVQDGRVFVSTTPVDPDELETVTAQEPVAEAPVAEAATNGASPATTSPAPERAAPERAAPERAVPERTAPEREPAPEAPCAAPAPTTLHAHLIAAIERLRWLEASAQWLGTALRPVREGRLGGRLFDLLHGRVMGHALHPALSDLPIGLWVGAIVLEVASEGRAAGILAAGGVVAGLATAVTGVADWTVSDGRDRRVGLLHGLTQTIAIVLVTASVVLRIVDVAAGAVALLAAGTGLSLASAYLGGHLVLGRGVMVDHNAWTVGPRQWTSTVAVAELEDGRPQMADVDGRQILVTRVDGVISAIENACSHAGGPLSMGAVRDGTVTCPWHGSCFRLRDGAVLNGPAQAPQPMLETRVREGVVQVRGRRVPRTVETNH